MTIIQPGGNQSKSKCNRYIHSKGVPPFRSAFFYPSSCKSAATCLLPLAGLPSDSVGVGTSSRELQWLQDHCWSSLERWPPHTVPGTPAPASCMKKAVVLRQQPECSGRGVQPWQVAGSIYGRGSWGGGGTEPV